MRRSAAPSQKVGFPSDGCSFSQNTVSSNQGTCHPKAARSTASILSLLETNEEENNGNTPFSNICCDIKENLVQNTSLNERNFQSNNFSSSLSSSSQENSPKFDNLPGKIKFFNVVWAKQSTKKHKTWEGDGTLQVSEKSVILKDSEGKILGTSSRVKSSELEEGSRFFVGSKEVEIVDIIATAPESQQNCGEQSMKSADNNALSYCNKGTQSRPSKRGKFSHSFTLPMKKHMVPGLLEKPPPLVLPRPPSEHQWKYNTSSLPVTEVIVDPFLVRILRPHQKDGVVFLYECIMGIRKLDFQGAILADEMGLGKTLQCITLVWTLLKKGPYGGMPVLKYVIIVTPSSLVSNWEKEFLSWLGSERINLFVVNQKNKPQDYGKYKREPVMLISYEMFARYYEEIISLRFDLLICDEGHRLKNSSIKVSNLLAKLICKRKILLTGTPIQNDLQEFFALIDFVNPGVLGSIQDFRQYFEIPIVSSRQPKVHNDVKELGESRATELNSSTKWFILRRTQDVINKFLPKKYESVIFCSMTDLQAELYKAAVSYWVNRADLPYSDKLPHLSVITALKKICNHPSLVLDKSESISDYIEQVCGSEHTFSVNNSGKLTVLMSLLQELCGSEERIVIVSYYTQTLDLLATICDQHGFKHCRLDGSVPSAQRQKIVDQFNSSYSSSFVFLLSARAGGVGLNLTGASRLVLYDCDWNPATDLQAMSRIWRDGQKRSVYIYRLLTTGSIEEKIFQRQLSKTSLSGAVIDPQNKDSIKLSNEELKDLFSLHEDVSCLTHDLLKCECSGSGEIPGLPKDHVELKIDNSVDEFCSLFKNSKSDTRKLHMNELYKWEHHGQPLDSDILKMMALLSSNDYITYIFRNTSTD